MSRGLGDVYKRQIIYTEMTKLSQNNTEIIGSAQIYLYFERNLVWTMEFTYFLIPQENSTRYFS